MKYCGCSDSGIYELNGMESLAYASIKVPSAGWQGGNAGFASMDMYFGLDYHWTVELTEIGGTVRF